MDDQLAHAVARIPGWPDADALTISPIGGLTNRNYRVRVNDEEFVLRVGGKNALHLGIDRKAERECLIAAGRIGIGPEVVHFVLPEGHLVARFIPGRHWSYDEYCQPLNLSRIVDAVKQIHGIPGVAAAFSPFRRVESYQAAATAYGVRLPEDFELFLKKMRAIEESQRNDRSDWRRFCHNDLYGVNFLDAGSMRIIDWEFAGVNDVYFDLATLVNAYDEDGPLRPELQYYILQCYFSEVTPTHRSRLEDMTFMLLFFTAMWGLLQHGLTIEGLVAPVQGFDYLLYAEDKFAEMRDLMTVVR